MRYLIVSLSGLSGAHHPALSGVTTSTEVKQMRPHLKMLSGDYLTFQTRSEQSGGSPDCRLCPASIEGNKPAEDIEHVLTKCIATDDIREKLLLELATASALTSSEIDFQYIMSNSSTLTQYILDCTSFHLNNACRVNINDPAVNTIFKKAREMVFKIHSIRISKLEEGN